MQGKQNWCQFCPMTWAVVGAGSCLAAEEDVGWLQSAEHTLSLW